MYALSRGQISFPLESNKTANYESDNITLFITVIEFGGNLFSLCFDFPATLLYITQKGCILGGVLGPIKFLIWPHFYNTGTSKKS
jgi:hypothetical protein